MIKCFIDNDCMVQVKFRCNSHFSTNSSSNFFKIKINDNEMPSISGLHKVQTSSYVHIMICICFWKEVNHTLIGLYM